MHIKVRGAVLCAVFICSMLPALQAAPWWNPRWRLRTTVIRTTPYRDDTARPVEVAVDFSRLLQRAGVRGEFDPASLRVVEPGVEGDRGRQVPFAYRTEFDAGEGRDRAYLAWIARPQVGQLGTYDIYFDTTDRGIEAQAYRADALPPENLLANPGFEEATDGLPAAWTAQPRELVSLGRFVHTSGKRSLKIVVDESTPEDVGRGVNISQKIDVRNFAGQEMVFECDLLAARAVYGAPLSIKLEQFRADGSPIRDYAINPRWLSLELAQGQLVQFSERGRFNPEAASVNLLIRVRCSVTGADTGERVTGPESFFTVWLDRVVVRPGERWPWPAASNAGFAEGALDKAPLNRGFEFTGMRRLAFNGASEGTLTGGKYGGPEAVHWGLQAGTLEFWCKPSWNADDGVDRIFFQGSSDVSGMQSQLRKLGADGHNELKFVIADADNNKRTISGPAPLRKGQWHHITATWDFPKAHLQLFVDGELVASEGPGDEPWASSLIAKPEGGKKTKGCGISAEDSRSMPMQAFFGGDAGWREDRAAEAVLDEFRISDVARYRGDFSPPREEFAVDEHTRVLFHFENERHGVHDSDDRFVRGYLGCELEPQEQEVPLEVLDNGKRERRMALVKPHAPPGLYEANRVENRMPVRRPVRPMPDPRFVQYRERKVERVVTPDDEGFMLEVGGDLEPRMRSVTFEYPEGANEQTTLLPRWRANDNVVPFSAESLAATLVPDATDDIERAREAFEYAMKTTRYYDADYCETLPGGRHRPRVSYTLLKALNIYPFDQCGPLNHMLRKLFLTAGISSIQSSGTHHSFETAFYKGAWRLFDLSSRQYWLNRDNTTVASLRGAQDDPYIKLRQDAVINAHLPGHKGGAMFGSAHRPHNMDFPLRPGERASICWHNEGRWFEVTGEDRKPIRLEDIPPYFGNGAIVYEPTGEGEAAALESMVVEATANGSSVLRAQDATKPATLVYRAQCPYIFSDGLVTGAYDAQEAGAVILSLSFDEGESWTEVWRSSRERGELAANLREHVTGRYAYWLKIDLAAGSKATVTGLRVRTTLVDSPLSLPGRLSLGENRISFVGGLPSVPIKTTCSWVERYHSDLGVSLNSISYYTNDEESHRRLFLVGPGEELPVSVTLQGRRVRGEVSLEGLPAGWSAEPQRRPVEVAETGEPVSADFVVRAAEADEGGVQAFELVIRQGDNERRVPAQVLTANAPLVREAEGAEEVSGEVAPLNLAELSGGRGMSFRGDGQLGYDFTAAHAGKYALWVHARWERGSRTITKIIINEGEARQVHGGTTLGFRHWPGWESPKLAHTKTVKHYAYYPGASKSWWSWYRIGDLQVSEGEHRLTLGAGAGAQFDALVLLPQTDIMDRAAMNLFQNWNYAPWDNPLTQAAHDEEVR